MIGSKAILVGRRRAMLGAATLPVTLLAAPAIVRAQGANGVALVIGNSKYHWESSLPNVKRDVPDVARRFEALGLRTELVQDVGREAMARALDKFAQSARGARFAAFYFAGHGVYWEKQSYLVPVDADLADPRTVTTLAKVPTVEAIMKQAGGRMLVLDSCRNNPADGWRQREAKLQARVDAVDSVGTAAPEPNSLVLFSTAPGGTALDGPAGQNSPFAAAFLRQLDGPKVDMQTLGAKVRRDLLLATECRQLVWDHNTYAAPFVLDNAGKAAASPLRHDPARILELPNAYAFAQKNGLPLPPGLVAYRAAPGTPDAEKIGSFSFSMIAGIGNHQGSGSGGGYPTPALFMVLSAVEPATAEVVVSSKNYRIIQTHWRYATAEKSGRTVAWDNPDDSLRFQMIWSDQNAGTFNGLPGKATASTRSGQTSRFTRLDG